MSKNKSCFDCPMALAPNDKRMVKLYGGPLNAAVCPVKGLLLETPRMKGKAEVQALSERIAEKCDTYGHTPTAETETLIGIEVGVGVPDEPPADTGKPSSCRSCHFFVPSSYIEDELGIPMGLCAKFGNLIPDAKASFIARECKVGKNLHLGPGANMSMHAAQTLGKFQISPSLAQTLPTFNLFGALFEKPKVDVADPTEYETDKPVTPAAQAQGIRAWRKVVGPEDKFTYLPIFRRDFFDPEEQKKIPNTGDDTHPELYEDHQNIGYTAAVLWRELDETPALHGVAGTGKTEFFRYMAWLMQLPFERISITRSSEIDDLAGKTGFVANETVFEHGRIPQAWGKPCVIVIDEPNVGPPDVWQFIRPLTDNSKQLVLDMNGGERIDRNENCYLGMAMNPAWDPRNIGAEVISDADGSRLMHIFVDYPSEAVERRIIRERCEIDGYDIPEDTLSKIMAISRDLRNLSRDHTLEVTWGLRPQIKVARATRFFPLPQAYRLAVADYTDPEQSNLIMDTVRNHS